MSRRMTAIDKTILSVLTGLLMVWIAGGLEMRAESGDSRQNLHLGLRLAQEGIYNDRHDDELGYHRREPALPFLIAGLDLARDAVGLDRLPRTCGEAENTKEPSCVAGTATYRVLLAIILALAAAAAFALSFALTGQRAAAYGAFLLTGTSSTLIAASHRFLTEIPAACLLIMVSLAWVWAWRSRRPAAFVLLGLASALLVLTKVIFAYLWLLIVLATLAMALAQRSVDRRLLMLLGLFIAAHALPTVSWMTRNYIQSDHFALTEKRSFKVLSVRAAYNSMRWDEYFAGFAYYTPMFRPNDLEAMGIEARSFERFDTKNEDGFRRTGQKQYRKRLCEFYRIAYPSAAPTEKCDMPRAIAEQIGSEAKARILADPLAHLRVTILLAYRALFPERGLGYWANPKAPNLAAESGLPWPKLGHRFSLSVMTWYNMLTAFALFAMPFLLYRQRRDLSGLIVVLPVLYSHGAYAFATHFIPRYATPEIPIRVTALLVLLTLVLSMAMRALPRPGRSDVVDDTGKPAVQGLT